MDISITLWLEIIAIASFSVSGAVLAIDKGLDIFGIVFVGVITALGGGVLRDLILGIFPPIMFTNKVYVIVAIITALIIFLIAFVDKERYFRNVEKIDSIVNIFDAVGIGLYSSTIVQKCIDLGYGNNAFLCIMMAMTTCVGGGMMRDLMCQRLPIVLRKRVYAIAVIIGSSVYYCMYLFNCSVNISTVVGTTTTILIRLLATKYRWNMPTIKKIS